MSRFAESILFFTPFGYWQVHNQLDLAVAAAARSRGLRTTYIGCDAFYQPCAMERGQMDCDSCQGAMDEIAAPFAMSREPLSGLTSPGEVAAAEAWVQGLGDDALTDATSGDLPIGDWALSTVMTHFRIGNIADLRRDAIISIHRRFLRDTLLTYRAIERVIDRERIDAVFLFNARFYPYRAAFEASRRRGLRVLVHERGRIANSFTFFENEGCLSPDTVSHLVADWADQPLDDAQLQHVDDHFSQLMLGRSPSWPSFYDQMKSRNPLDMLDIPRDAKIVAFFSSSSDEIAAQISSAKVASQTVLIDRVAAILEENGAYLVVRHHPHIGGGPVGSPVEPSAFFEAYEHTRSRRPNVRVIMPKDELTSNELFPYLAGAIAPFTSLGLQTTAFGIPTLVSRGSISAFDKRYEIDDWSVPELQRKMAFLLCSEAKPDGARLRAFYRTFYSRFHRFSLRFQAVGMADYIKPSVSPNLADAIRVGRDPSLERVMSYLIEGKQVHERPRPNQSLSVSSPEAEDRYIAHQLHLMDERAGARDPDARRPLPGQGTERVAILCEEMDAESTSVRLADLPNADRIVILPFSSKPSSAWRQPLALMLGRKEEHEFDAWARGLLETLDLVDEERVLVVSGRHQFHDASIGTIIGHCHMAGASGPVMPLSGWFAEPTRLRPERISASTLTLADWGQMRHARPHALRRQDVLSLGLVDKSWLRRNLQTAEQLETAFFDEVSKTGPTAPTGPVFLWHLSVVGLRPSPAQFTTAQ